MVGSVFSFIKVSMKIQEICMLENSYDEKLFWTKVIYI